MLSNWPQETQEVIQAAFKIILVMGLTQTIVTMKKLTDRLGVKGQRQKCLKCNLSLEFVTQDKEALFYQDKKYFQSITAMIENKEQKYTVV